VNQNEIIRKAGKIKLLLLDVDGILTDGQILYNEKGREIKSFHVQDGQGIRWLIKSGVEVGFLSGRISQAVAKRAEELGVPLLFQGIKNKVKIFEGLLTQKNLNSEQISFMGDDFVDLPLLKKVGFSISVRNGHPLIQKEVDYVTKTQGGYGAVREVSELIIKAKGRWDSLLRGYGFLISPTTN
jgi:3-deoxy-D-manno-octulosonate 8-phosphate phosphatase (KDO 8-P phosphatase)